MLQRPATNDNYHCQSILIIFTINRLKVLSTKCPSLFASVQDDVFKSFILFDQQFKSRLKNDFTINQLSKQLRIS